MKQSSTASILNKLWYLIPIIGIFMLLMCEPAHGQNKPDTLKYNDSIPIISADLVNKILLTKKDVLSVSQWEGFLYVLNTFIFPEAIREWNEKNKKKKPQ